MLYFLYWTTEIPTYLNPNSVLRKLKWERELWYKHFECWSQALVLKWVLPRTSFVVLDKSHNLSELPLSSHVGVSDIYLMVPMIEQSETKYPQHQEHSSAPRWPLWFRGDVHLWAWGWLEKHPTHWKLLLEVRPPASLLTSHTLQNLTCVSTCPLKP